MRTIGSVSPFASGTLKRRWPGILVRRVGGASGLTGANLSSGDAEAN